MTVVVNCLLRSRPVAASTILVVALAGLLVLKNGPMTVQSKRSRSQLHFGSPAEVIAQTAESDENEVSTDEVAKYVSVYKAMQRNRSLTVDQAAAAQGLTTKQFRELENRVQRDDAALQEVRDELQAAAQSTSAGRSSVPIRP